MIDEDRYHVFESWENRLRGWDIFDCPVYIEPLPQEPSYGKAPVIDDGRFRLFERKKKVPTLELVEPEAHEFLVEEELVAFGISLNEFNLSDDALLGLLATLSGTENPITFEIHGNSEEITFRLVCCESEGRALGATLRGYFGNQVSTVDPTLMLSQERELAIIDFGLDNVVTRPLATVTNFGTEPLLNILSLLDDLTQGEEILFQIQFQGNEFKWSPIMAEVLFEGGLDGIYSDGSTAIELYEEKFIEPLFSVRIRSVIDAPEYDDVIGLAVRSIQALGVTERYESNSLIPLTNEGLAYEDHYVDIHDRTFHRPGFLMNGEELGVLVRVPEILPHISKLRPSVLTTVPLPEHLKNGLYKIGINSHEGVEAEAFVGDKERLRHHFVIGSTGVGKSTYLVSLAIQDALKGNGFSVLDPHGDLIDDILHRLPEDRLKDVILFDPSDTQFPIGFNLLQAQSEEEEIILSSDLVSVFKDSSTSWGDQMSSILANAISVFLERKENGTLLELQHFLQNEDYRTEVLTSIYDPIIRNYWLNDFPQLRKGTVAPILTRLGTFLRPKIIRNMMAIKDGLDFSDLLQSKKIFLAKLSQGQIGEDNSNMLGKLLLSKIYQAALGRQRTASSERHPHYLYVDEFHSFISSSFVGILTGIRKYGLGLTCACQNLIQMNKVSGLREIMLSNAYVRSTFRLGDDDAQILAKNSRHFEPSDFVNLGTGDVILRVGKAQDECTMKTQMVERIRTSIETVQNTTREKYSHDRKEIEKIILDLYNLKTQVVEKEIKEEIPKEPTKELDDFTQSKEAFHKGEVEKQQKRLHVQIQEQVKTLAHSLGFRAELEQELAGGRVDVLLENDSTKIAVEVSVTNTIEYELENIQKCINGKSDYIVFLSPDKKKRDSMREKVSERFSEEDVALIKVFSEQEFQAWLRSVSKPEEKEQRIGGFKVKVKFDSEAKEEELAKRVVDIMRGRKGGK